MADTGSTSISSLPLEGTEPSKRELVVAVIACALFVLATRVAVARPQAYDFDETGYLITIQKADFPKQHTLFLAAARVLGDWVGDPYSGFLVLDAATSVLAMAGTWWMLRGFVPARTALACTLVLGVAPVFWAYGAMAANYTMIPLVGSLLLGIAWRGRRDPRPWHPYVAAVVLGIGTGYRQDIGVFWMPVFVVVLWQHRWVAAVQAGLVFTLVNLSWLIPMLRDAGGWANYHAETGKFAHSAGYLNSIFVLGPIDATARYGLKIAMALAWTLGVGLLFVPRGLRRVWNAPGGGFLVGLMLLAAIPALAMHLLIHFGVQGYAFHYVPALMILLAVGLGKVQPGRRADDRRASYQGLAIAASLAAVFLFYPTNYEQGGFRGEFDLAFARSTRVGLATRLPMRDVDLWRTAGSQRLPENTVAIPTKPRSLFSIFQR